MKKTDGARPLHLEKFLSMVLITVLTFNVMADFESAAELYRQRSYIAALEAFTHLAEAGDPRAQTVLAIMHQFGEGTKQDSEKAFQWYYEAAKNGYPAAQFHAGVMYSNGTGVQQDEQQALYWLTRSAEHGFDKAKDKIEALNASLIPQVGVPGMSGTQNWNFRLPNRFRIADPSSDLPSPDDEYRAQVGAMGTRSGANKLWNLLLQSHTTLFTDLQPYFVSATVKPNQRVYQVLTGPFANYAAVSQFCEKLLMRSIQAGCIPVRDH